MSLKETRVEVRPADGSRPECPTYELVLSPSADVSLRTFAQVLVDALLMEADVGLDRGERTKDDALGLEIIANKIMEEVDQC
jgi:hypothetical protein